MTGRAVGTASQTTAAAAAKAGAQGPVLQTRQAGPHVTTNKQGKQVQHASESELRRRRERAKVKAKAKAEAKAQAKAEAEAVSTRILGSCTAPFPPFLIPHRVPHGFTQDPSTDSGRCW